MRILYVAPKYDYGKPEQGYSFEHYNFYDFFQRSGHNIIYVDTLSLVKELGKGPMNRLLLETAKAEQPDLMFTVLFTDELDPAVVRQISEDTNTLTLNWFCDDHWRYENYSQHWAPCFNWVVTTAKSAVPKYAQLPYPHAIKSQWGCNHLLYQKLDLPLKYDVSFVGQPHGNRRQIIRDLQKKGIKVHTFGAGWPSGRVSQEMMIQIFNQSRINLNLSNASVSSDGPPPEVPGRLEWLSRTLDHVPFGGQIKKYGATLVNFAATRASIRAGDRTTYFEQIKGRNFEVPGCGGFMLTGKAEDLESYYKVGREIVCFDDTGDLVDKIHYYLDHEDERAAIARAGYERTLHDHTYEHRFGEIFKAMNLYGFAQKSNRGRS
jgi:spore maturation protein CgeB